MVRLSLALALALMVSAISLVTARYQSRQLFVAVERLEDRARELDIEWRRLQLERAELARNARVDHIARSDLGMVTATPDRSIYLGGEMQRKQQASAESVERKIRAAGERGRP